MLKQQGENEFEVFDLPISDVTKLLVKQDLNITNINSQTIKCVHTSYLAVIKALFNLGYYQDGNRMAMQKNYQKYNKMYNTEIYFHKDQELGIFLTKITNGEQQDWSLRKITTTISQYVHKQKLIDPSCPEMIQADSQLMKALGQQTFHTNDLVNLITSQINKV